MYFRTVLVSNNHAFGRSRVRSEHDAILRRGQLFPNLGVRADPPGDTRVTQRGPHGASGRAASPARSLRTRPAGGGGPARPPARSAGGRARLTLNTTPAMVVPVLRAAGRRSPFGTSSASSCEFLQHSATSWPGRGLPPPQPPRPPAPARARPRGPPALTERSCRS